VRAPGAEQGPATARSYTRAMAFLFKGKKLPEGVDPARIPPGQTLTAPDRWPLLHFGPVPKTDIAKWDFKVFGAVENELTLDYGELRALQSKTVVADIHCVTGWSRLGDTWTGVPIKEILARVKPKPEAKYVMAHSEYGYTTSVPLEVLDNEQNLLCYAWNGQDLTPEHGWPLRLFVPSKYFWKSAKWLTGIELSAADMWIAITHHGKHFGLRNRLWLQNANADMRRCTRQPSDHPDHRGQPLELYTIR